MRVECRESMLAKKEELLSKRESSASTRGKWRQNEILKTLEKRRKSIQAVGAGVRKRERSIASREKLFYEKKQALDRRAAEINSIAEDVELEKQRLRKLYTTK